MSTIGHNQAPKRRAALTAEEKIDIAEKREKGWGLEMLAKEFKCTTGSISWCCLMQGVTAPGAKDRKPQARPKEYMRNGKLVRTFTPEEDTLIEGMSMAGKTITEIQTATGRRHNSIVGRLATLAKNKELSE